MIHLISLLQEGFMGRLIDLPHALRSRIGLMLKEASDSPLLLDKKWALEIVGPAPPDAVLAVLRAAIISKSPWLQDIAYRQAAKLGTLPDDVLDLLRRSLVRMAVTGRLARNHVVVKAFVSRLPFPRYLLAIVRLLFWLPLIDGFLLASSGIVLLRFASGPILVALARTGLWVAWGMLALWCFAYWASKMDSNMLLFEVVPARSLPLFFTGINFAYVPNRRPSLAIIMIIITYVLCWSVTSLWSARIGDFVDVGWWAVQPITPLVRFFKAPSRYVRKAASYAVPLWPLAILMLMSVGLVVFLHSWIDKHSLLLSICFITPVGILLLILLAIGLHDLRFWRQLRRRAKRELEPSDLLELIAKCLDGVILAKVLKYVRVSGMVKSDYETEQVLRAVAVNTGTVGENRNLDKMDIIWMFRNRRSRQTVDLNNLRGPSVFCEWYKRVTKDGRRRITLSGLALDELNKLIEQITQERSQSLPQSSHPAK
jgi:hypothetical protein